MKDKKRNLVVALFLIGCLISFLPMVCRVCILVAPLLFLFVRWDDYEYQTRYEKRYEKIGEEGCHDWEL